MARAALNTTASAERPYLSKSKFLWGSQCKKLLWVAYNDRNRIPEPDAATQAIFDQGHEVGEWAKALYRYPARCPTPRQEARSRSPLAPGAS